VAKNEMVIDMTEIVRIEIPNADATKDAFLRGEFAGLVLIYFRRVVVLHSGK